MDIRWLYAALTILALAAAAFLCILTAQRAGAGISAQGYANVAQRAVNRVGGPYGYHAKCVGKYNIPGPNFTIKCTVNERG